MPRGKYLGKEDLVEIITTRRKDIVGNAIVETGLIDSLVPLAGMDGKIQSIDDDGTVTIEFSGPIQSYLSLLSRKKLQAIVESLEESGKEVD